MADEAPPVSRAAAIVERTLVYDNWLRIHRVRLAMPDGRVSERHLEDHGTAVAVLPYDAGRRVAIVIRQPRVPVLAAGEAPVIELIAGLDDGEPPETAAAREAMEEAGLALARFEPVSRIWPMIGISAERMSIFLAPYAAGDRVGEGGGAAHENEAIEVVEMPLAALGTMARAGTLSDAKTLIAVQALMLRRGDLFE